MNKTVTDYYKFPLMISIVLSIVLMAVASVRIPIEATQIIIGAFLGTFVLDMEYILYSYVLEPTAEFSKTMVGFIKHRDFKNAINHIRYHKEEINDKSLNSGLFQGVVAILSLFVVTATSSLFAKAFVLSILANSLYKLTEYYFDAKLDDWFWAFKTKPTKRGAQIFFAGISAILIVCIALI